MILSHLQIKCKGTTILAANFIVFFLIINRLKVSKQFADAISLVKLLPIKIFLNINITMTSISRSIITINLCINVTSSVSKTCLSLSNDSIIQIKTYILHTFLHFAVLYIKNIKE